MGNVLRIVIGLGGLFAAGWSALRTLRRRREERAAGDEEPGRTPFAREFAILAATAVGVALTLLI
ncbi:hypothetical protein [Jiangella sp. DSM 45060]|uniref:hypothetical protein n=1 Tax=Jiangella sp. DSM 45060 TaxID=1798224 RepID=UPI00087C2520|nr:hypothetical protein [Jiangella sp. DSM 45060]SDS28625.1 hypothetical protein SAMN04515669_0750 [Jiangella sp. DSM 45060]